MNFQDIGATGIIGILILGFAVIGFLKGLIRSLLAMACLGIAGYAAFYCHEHAIELTESSVAKTIAAVAGIIVFFICRYVLKFLIDPFNRSKAGKRIGFGVPAALLSLCGGLVILWLGITGISYSGALAELRQTRDMILKKEGSKNASAYVAPILLKAKKFLDVSSLGKWHQQTNPFYKPEKLALCQILVLYYHDAPTRQTLLNNTELNQLLNQPAFIQLAYQEKIKTLALSGSLRTLYKDDAITKTLTESDLVELLQNIDLSQLTSVSLPTVPSALPWRDAQ